MNEIQFIPYQLPEEEGKMQPGEPGAVIRESGQKGDINN